MNRIRNVLMELGSVGMKGALLVGNDGLLIEAVTLPDDTLDANAIAALAASVLGLSRHLTENLKRSHVEDIFVRLEQGGVIMRAIAKDVIAVVLTDTMSSIALLQMKLRRLAPQIAEALEPEIAIISRPAAPVPPLPRAELTNGGEVLVSNAAASGGSEATKGLSSREPSFVGSVVVAAPTNGDSRVATVLGEGAEVEAVDLKIAPDGHRETPGLFRGISLQPDALNAEWPSSIMTTDSGEGVKPDIVVEEVGLDLNGSVTDATVTLALGDLRARGKALGRNTPERQLRLIAEATARALNELLSPGYGVVVHDIARVPVYSGYSLRGQVIFITPTEDKRVLGVMPIDDDLPMVAAKTVVGAVHQYIGPALKTHS